jgi:threonine synthase
MPSKTVPLIEDTPRKNTDDALDARKAAILNAVVSEYVESAQPVGSAHVTGIPGVEVSSATVRSEMAALESEGYLVQPHTSAGVRRFGASSPTCAERWKSSWGTRAAFSLT